MFFVWPIRDEFGIKNLPLINYTIIFVNVIIYLLLGFSSTYQEIVKSFGFIPDRFSWTTIFTSMFLHGSIMHLIGNMWYLYLMGDNLEDRWGHFQYLFFYLFSGVIAALFYGIFTYGEVREIPSIGASGAISGVLGAYAILFPKSRITLWYYIFAFFRIFSGTFDLFAFFWIFIWFFQQIIGMMINMGSTVSSGIAFGAHVGGFLAGMGIALLTKSFQRRRYISSVRSGRNVLYDIAGEKVIKMIPFENQVELFNIENHIKQLIQDKNEREAALLYGDALKKFGDVHIPKSLEYKFAELLKQQGLFDEATLAYRKFIRNNPFSNLADNALYNLGTLYLDKGEKEKAKNCFRQIAIFYPYSEINDASRYALSNIKRSELS